MKFERLGNIADIIAGQSPPSSTYNSEGKGLPFFQGKADYGEKYPSVRFWCTEPTKISLPEDILISMRAPVGPVNINVVESCIGRGLSAIRVKKNVSRDYIYYWLKLNQHIISAKETGSTFKAITQKVLNEILVPFPSYNDQTEIADSLIKAENLIAQRKESIRLQDEFLKSTFLEMFGDPVSNEKGFRKSRLSTITKIGTGGTPSRKMEIEYYHGIIPWVKTAEVNGAYIFNTDEKITEAALRKSNCTIYPIGTILLAMYGQGKTRGNVGFLKIEATTNQACGAILPSNELNSMFLFEQLKQMYYHIRSMAKGSNQENLNLSIVGNICVIIPPLKLQAQFAQIVEKTEALKAQYQQSLGELENLFGSLSQRAFRGELSYELKKTVTT